MDCDHLVSSYFRDKICSDLPERLVLFRSVDPGKPDGFRLVIMQDLNEAPIDDFDEFAAEGCRMSLT